MGSQTEIDNLLMEGMVTELQQLRLEINLYQQAAVSELTLEKLQGKDDKVRCLTGLLSFIVLSTLFNYLLPFLPKKNISQDFKWLS